MSNTRVVKCICCWDVMEDSWPSSIPYMSLCDECVVHVDSCRTEAEGAAEALEARE
jgi:hypothetical protein